VTEAQQIRVDYAGAMARVGETIEVDRQNGTAHFRVPCLARVRGSVPDVGVPGQIQGEATIRALISDLITNRFPLPVRTTDAVWVRGRRMAITEVDNNSGRVGATQVYVLIKARG
jgi:hypothetical protein